MKRVSTWVNNWPTLLIRYVAEHEDSEFKWGTTDCVSFAAGGVEVMTGHNYMEQVPDYHTEEGSRAAFEALGFKNVVEVADFLFYRIKMPSRGTLVCRKFETGRALGLCLGCVDVFMSPRGLTKINVELPEASVIRWRI